MNEPAKTIRIDMHNGKLDGSGNQSAPQIRIKLASSVPNVSPAATPSEAPAPAPTPVNLQIPEVKRYQCPHCGTILETDEAIEGMQVPCPECGADFVASPMQTSGAAFELSPPPLPPRSKKSGGVKWGVGVLVILLALLALAGGWWFMGGRKGESELPDGGAKKGPAMGVKGSCKVKGTLGLRSLRDHYLTLGGRVPPELNTFSPRTSGLESRLMGNPVYFLPQKRILWTHYESGTGDGHVFVRRAIEDYDEDQLTAFAERGGMETGLAMLRHGSNSAELRSKCASIWSNAVARTLNFPAPVVFSSETNDERFLYFNDAWAPSVLWWGDKTNSWFWCCEGESALAGYANTLRELRKVLVEYTAIAQSEGLKTYERNIAIKHRPAIYVGELEAATREQASVEYDFVVNGGDGRIKETSNCKSGKYYRSWNLESLDKELEFVSGFETHEATEQAFEQLSCFLTQQKIIFEEVAAEASRIDARFGNGGSDKSRVNDGKKQQKLDFAPIGKQFSTAHVELSATAESGGKVVFSVEEGPGKIEGNTLTFTSYGTVRVCARQWGNETWRMAVEIQNVEVVQQPQIVDFPPIGPQTVSSKVKLSATADSGRDVTFSVISGPGKIENGLLEFSGPGEVLVEAVARGDWSFWEPGKTTQTVVVVTDRLENSGGARKPRNVHSKPIGHTAQPIATHTRPAEVPRPVLPEYAELAGAVEVAQEEQTAENFKKLMEVWTGLGAKEKAATQKSVLWAYCAMLWSKGNTAAAEKRQGAIDYRAFLQAVTDPCRACNGRGGKQETCRYCHGSGMVESGRSGSGSCPFCHGSGQVGGRLGGHPSTCPKCGGSGKSGSASGGRTTCPNCTGGTIREVCRTCGGTGRVYSASKCKRIVEENLEEALRICHGENEAGRQGGDEEETWSGFGGW